MMALFFTFNVKNITMATLYEGKMAEIYDAMYQTFVNYDEEFLFYSNILKENNCNSVLEIGSGTGNLSKRFATSNINYIGLEYSNSMIEIAKNRNPTCDYILADMRNFNLENPVESIIITGRTTSYLITNADIKNTFSSIYKNLSKNGIVCFDFIDANRYIPYALENQLIEHTAEYDGVKYYREGNWQVAPLENFMLNWTAKYYTYNDGIKNLVSEDFSTVRVFTLNEIQLFLHLNNFDIIQTIDRKTYAYDTFVIVAKKR